MRKRLLSLGLIMVLCFSLTGCKSSDYKKAVELQNSGDYAGALELFKGIGDDYKDVSDRATECQSFIDSITAFDEAKSLLDDKNAELDKAISEANDLVNGENTALVLCIVTGRFGANLLNFCKFLRYPLTFKNFFLNRKNPHSNF